MPLAVRVAVVVAGLMVALGVLASQQVLATLGRVQTDRIRELATTHVEALSVALGPLVLRRDVWEVYDTLERAKLASDVERIVFTAVADADGKVLAASDPGRAPVGSSFSAIAEGATDLDTLAFSPRQTRLKISSPLIYQGRNVGTLLSEVDVADLIAERTHVTRLLIVWNTVVTTVLVLIGVFASRRMLAPLAELADRMSLSGDEPQPIPAADLPGRDTEFGQLARTYNAMATAVRQKTEAERRLAERERFVSLGRLASSLAHEINNPLGGLLNATDTIRTYAEDPKTVRTSAEIVERGLRHLRDVARATLDQNRLDRSGQPASAEDFEDIRLLIEPEVRRRSQTLVWDVSPEIEGLARFPAAPVRQITLNLLLNASAAAPERGRIGLAVWAEDGAVHLRVSDDGPGLTPSARQRLMSSGQLPPDGGVGLRVVHDLVEELGGQITLPRGQVPEQSRTQVEVTLPCAPGDEDADA